MARREEIDMNHDALNALRLRVLWSLDPSKAPKGAQVETRRGIVFGGKREPGTRGADGKFSDFRNVKVRVSNASLTLLAQVVNPARKSKEGQAIRSYETLATFPLHAPITGRAVTEALAKVGAVEQAKKEESLADIRRKAAAKSERANRTFGDWAKLFFEDTEVKARVHTLDEVEQTLNAFFLSRPSPDIERPGLIRDLKPTDYVLQNDDDFALWDDWLKTIARPHEFNGISYKPSLHRARLTRAAIMMLLKYAKARSFPIPDAVKIPKEKRARINPLKADEIKRLWDACEQLSPPDRDFMFFVMLTARRRKEASLLCWHWIDFEAGVIRFPAVTAETRPDAPREDRLVMKNKTAFEMPLTPRVRKLLEQRERIAGSPYVFTKDGITPLENKRLIYQLDCIMTDTKYKPRGSVARTCKPFEWRIHDIRDTAVTSLKRYNQLTQDHRDLLLGHALGNGDSVSASNYETAGNPFQSKNVFLVWEAHLLSIVEPAPRDLEKEKAAARIKAEILKLGLDIGDLVA